jgi:hypothetical protein
MAATYQRRATATTAKRGAAVAGVRAARVDQPCGCCAGCASSSRSLLVAVIVAGAVLVFTSRSDLREARRHVDNAWTPLQEQLDVRYDVLHSSFTDGAVRGLPGPLNSIVRNVAMAYQHWRDLGSTTAASRPRSPRPTTSRRPAGGSCTPRTSRRACRATRSALARSTRTRQRTPEAQTGRRQFEAEAARLREAARPATPTGSRPACSATATIPDYDNAALGRSSRAARRTIQGGAGPP